MSNTGQAKGVTIPSHRAGIGAGDSESVLIPKQYGRIAEWVNKHIRSLHAHGAGALWCPDHIVSDAWATKVATGRGTEGETVTTYQGETVRIWSTWNGALAAAVDNDVIAICQGAYTEDVTIPANITVHIIVLGRPAVASSASGDWAVTLQGSTGSSTPALTVTAGNGRSSITGVCFLGKAGQTAAIVDVPTSAVLGRIQDCGFFPVANQLCLDLTNALGVIDEIYDCYFAHATGAVGIDTGVGTHDQATIRGCTFLAPTGIRCGEDVIITGCYFNGSSLELGPGTAPNDTLIEANYFLGGKIVATEPAGDITIRGNHFDNVSVNPCIDFTSEPLKNSIISGNTFNMNAQTAVTCIGGISTCQGNIITDNTVLSTVRLAAARPTAYDSNWSHWTNYKARNYIVESGGIAAGGTQGAPYEADMDSLGNLSPSIYAGSWGDFTADRVAWEAFACRFGDTVVSVAAGDSGALAASSTFYMEVDSGGTVYFTSGSFTAARIPLAVITTAAYGRIDDVDRKGALLFLAQTAGGSNPAPNDAQYLVLALDGDLSAERRLVPGSGLTGTDGGADGDYTLDLGTLTGAWVPGAQDIGNYDYTAKPASIFLGAADVEIKRWAANQWGALGDLFILEAANDSTAVFNARVTGDSYPRFAMLSGGAIQFGSGAAVPDAMLYRIAANVLGLPTGDAFVITGAAGDFGTPVNGMLWYNTTTNKLRIYQGGAWVDAYHARYLDSEAVAALVAYSDGDLTFYDTLYLGANDVRNGLLGIYGQGTGFATGGMLKIYVASDHDTAFDNYDIFAYEDDLIIQHDSVDDLLIKADHSIEIPSGALNLAKYLDLTEVADPGTPAANHIQVRALASKKLVAENEDGDVFLLNTYRCPMAVIDPTSASTATAKLAVGPMPFAGAFVKVTIKAMPGETCGATAQLVDIHLQTAANENTDTSTTIWATQGNRPTITNTNKAGNSTTFDTATFAKGDWLYVFSDVLGTGLTGLLVGIEVRPTG